MDRAQELQARVAEAHDAGTPLRIRAGDSRAWYGNPVTGEILDLAGHSGIVEYQPSELVVTVRAGTPLAELEAALAGHRQMLAFEPPHHGEASTIGGAIACGLSGPRRVAAGAARDFMLGATVVNGLGQRLRFGGQVMKNVAGYDAARLMVGAQGTLGLLLDVSLKVLPMPEAEIGLSLALPADELPATVSGWVRRGLPLTASCHVAGRLYLRLGSTASAVRHAREVIAREHACEEIDPGFWADIRDQRHAFFAAGGAGRSLWRCSHLPATPRYGGDEQLLEWHGALRWVWSAEDLRDSAAAHGGHAQRHPLRGEGGGDPFQPLAPGLLRLQRRLKQAFDPRDILNPGRLYADLRPEAS